MNTGSVLDSLPGDPPPLPTWGQEFVAPNPHLARRISSRPGSHGSAAIVVGACGALGPDVVEALLLRGHAVLGLDLQGTYLVPGATYRALDLADKGAVEVLLTQLERLLAQSGLDLAGVYNLATIQTSPHGRRADQRQALTAGLESFLDLLCGMSRDLRLFHMSTAEVYGAPRGAPYREDHEKRPFNDYSRMKWAEEQIVLRSHGQSTRRGRLHTVALRCWTISMVSYDQAGNVRSTRNFNDPFIAVAKSLAQAGAKVPVVDPSLLCQFHPAEEIAEQAVLLTEQPLAAPTWGQAFNSLGRPATHGELANIAYETFASAGTREPRPWWAGLARLAFGGGRIPRSLLAASAHALELGGGLLGARDVAGRLPFMYRSTHMDSSAITQALKDQLAVPGGSSSVDAVRRLVLGLLRGGPGAINVTRYDTY